MSENVPPRGESDGEPDRDPAWQVDKEESLDHLSKPGDPSGGKLIYVDQHGRRRRLPADMAALTPEDRRAAVAALSSALGAPDPGYARMAAVERLTEMRAAGTLGEEDYKRERRRLMGEG